MKISLKVSGMSCAACAARIEKGLNKLEGVEQVRVNLASERASITYNPEKLSIKNMADKIENLGYSVQTQKVEVKVQGMT